MTKIYGTANIEFTVTGRSRITDKVLHKIRNELNEELECVVNSIFENHGIVNEEIHSVLMDELIKEVE